MENAAQVASEPTPDAGRLATTVALAAISSGPPHPGNGRKGRALRLGLGLRGPPFGCVSVRLGAVVKLKLGLEVV